MTVCSRLGSPESGAPRHDCDTQHESDNAGNQEEHPQTGIDRFPEERRVSPEYSHRRRLLYCAV